MDLVLLITVGFSWICYKWIPRFLVAFVVSVLLACVATVFAAQPHFGWFDSEFYKNLVICLCVSSVISLIVGMILKRRN